MVVVHMNPLPATLITIGIANTINRIRFHASVTNTELDVKALSESTSDDQKKAIYVGYPGDILD